MKSFAKTVFSALFILVFGFSINAQTVWTGAYQFDEDGGKTSGGTAINIYHTLEIRESADGLMATLKSNGYQTSVDLICTTKAENNKLMVYFAGYGEDNVSEKYAEGDLLLTLERKDDKILTFWGKFLPSVEKNEKSGKVYFRKAENSKEN
ncbi:MAG TPA: DUF5991 domain-containing protein [Pyrinomonadaceae bacterium]|nr:DUF5991 domain-containing protein [Pyrinomonadaceae bacterium]